ncbi:hypothetical protein VTN02DRAFT_1963 [Thermoascus thermophilus]
MGKPRGNMSSYVGDGHDQYHQIDHDIGDGEGDVERKGMAAVLLEVRQRSEICLEVGAACRELGHDEGKPPCHDDADERPACDVEGLPHEEASIEEQDRELDTGKPQDLYEEERDFQLRWSVSTEGPREEEEDFGMREIPSPAWTELGFYW